MADYLINAWESLLKLLQDNQQAIFQNPLVWIVFILVVVGIYGLYDVPNKTSSNSLGNVVRKLMQTLLNTTADVINALGSLTGFLKVVESLLFGKLNKRTLFILNNYAIIFLSIASFATTFSGLNLLLAWVLAAFVSFGVQVSILVFGIKISRYNQNIKKCLRKRRQITNYEKGLTGLYEISRNTKEVTRVAYRFSIPSYNYICKKSIKIINNGCNSVIGQQETVNPGESLKEENINALKIRYSLKTWRIKGIRFGVIILLMASLIVSSSFSYLFMFDKFVKDQLPYDDHYRSIEIVHVIVRDYSEELGIYEDGLVDILSIYNDKVSEWMELQENNPLILQEEIAQKRDELEELEAQRQDLEEQLLFEDDPQEMAVIELRRNNVLGEIETAQSDLGVLEFRARDSIYQNRLAAYESILELTNFYANPLYINEVGKNEILKSFLELIQVESQYQNNENTSQEHQEFTERQRIQVRDVFEMYYALCEYYADHNSIGIDFTTVEAQLNLDYSDVAEAEDYQAKTNELLTNMLEDLNAIPLLSAVVSPWSGESISVQNQEVYLAQLYDLYRDSSRTVTIFERALHKLLGLNNEKSSLARELAFLAISFDLLIVWLTLLRGKKHYISSLGDLRRLVGVLLLDDSLEEANRSFRKSQGFCSVLGIVGGILVFLLYKMNYYTEADAQGDMLTFLIFCVLGLITGLLINKIYIKIYQHKKNWDTNNLYLLWKQIWLDSGKDAEELAEHIRQLRENKEYEAASISMEGIKALEGFCVDAQRQAAFTQYIYQDVLDMFSDIETKELYKIIMIKTICKNQLEAVDYVSEQVTLPCIKADVVKKYNLQMQLNILRNRHLVELDGDYYILTERFWSILYDAILLCIVGGRISDHDIEEELAGNGEDEEEFY